MVKFNKMFVMIPVMLVARKLDGEDPLVVYWLRIAYGIMQFISVLVVVYSYLQAKKIASTTPSDRIVYVPPPPVPFADPNSKKKYTETKYGAHVESTTRSLLGSTLFGIALTVALHVYKGMVMGLAIQAVMAPLNLLENPVVKALFLGSGTLRPEDKIFDEKMPNELTQDDEVVDEAGNPVVRKASSAPADSANGSRDAASNGGPADTMVTTPDGKQKSLEDVLLDTWDAGMKADLKELMAVMQTKNCNYQTAQDKWTPLMILAGLGAPGSDAAIRQVRSLGANPAMVDVEGWTALHWAAFHGGVAAAKELSSETKLLSIKDKEGYNPIDMAKKEGNTEIAAIFESALEPKKTK